MKGLISILSIALSHQKKLLDLTLSLLAMNAIFWKTILCVLFISHELSKICFRINKRDIKNKKWESIWKLLCWNLAEQRNTICKINCFHCTGYCVFKLFAATTFYFIFKAHPRIYHSTFLSYNAILLLCWDCFYSEELFGVT